MEVPIPTLPVEVTTMAVLVALGVDVEIRKRVSDELA